MQRRSDSRHTIAGAGLALNARSNRSSALKRSVASWITRTSNSGTAGIVVQHEAPDFVDPAVIGILSPRDFDNDLIEDLARQHPAYRIVPLGEAVLVAVGEPKIETCTW